MSVKWNSQIGSKITSQNRKCGGEENDALQIADVSSIIKPLPSAATSQTGRRMRTRDHSTSVGKSCWSPTKRVFETQTSIDQYMTQSRTNKMPRLGDSMPVSAATGDTDVEKRTVVDG